MDCVLKIRSIDKYILLKPGQHAIVAFRIEWTFWIDSESPLQITIAMDEAKREQLFKILYTYVSIKMKEDYIG